MRFDFVTCQQLRKQFVCAKVGGGAGTNGTATTPTLALTLNNIGHCGTSLKVLTTECKTLRDALIAAAKNSGARDAAVVGVAKSASAFLQAAGKSSYLQFSPELSAARMEVEGTPEKVFDLEEVWTDKYDPLEGSMLEQQVRSNFEVTISVVPEAGTAMKRPLDTNSSDTLQQNLDKELTKKADTIKQEAKMYQLAPPAGVVGVKIQNTGGTAGGAVADSDEPVLLKTPVRLFARLDQDWIPSADSCSQTIGGKTRTIVATNCGPDNNS